MVVAIEMNKIDKVEDLSRVEEDSDSSVVTETSQKTDEDSEEELSVDDNTNSLDNDENTSSDDDKNTNAGWADSMAKILKSNKPKGKKSLVLSRAKKISDIKKTKTENVGFEVVGEIKEEKLSLGDPENEDEPKSKKRREDLPSFRVKPNVLEKEREKILSKIATRGVVQLFNAVRNQQKEIENKTEKSAPIERKKDKAKKSLDKNKFLDMLMGQSKSENVNREIMKKETKKEVKKEEDSTWNVFRDDFMMGAKMKDWDKKDKKAASDDENFSNDSDSDVE